MDTRADYLQRKGRELQILNDSLPEPAKDLPAVHSPQQALEHKLRLAALLRAADNLDHWRITETARQPPQQVDSAAHHFRFSYQRADLRVSGPPVYPGLVRDEAIDVGQPVYAASGMSAIATLLTALQQCADTVRVRIGGDCYDETLELMRCLGLEPGRSGAGDGLRVLWLDSSASQSLLHHRALIGEAATDLVVLDTSCLWGNSNLIRLISACSTRNGVPLALVRSHTKLDSLGIEYGRLGSVVLASPRARGARPAAAGLVRLDEELRRMQRLLGAVPPVASFPPFAAHEDFPRCGAARIAAIMRCTRRMARILAARLGPGDLVTYHHGLYLTLSMHALERDAVAALAEEIADALAARPLAVKQAGSFGFDFVAIDRHPAPQRDSDELRIAGADLPAAEADAIAHGIADRLESVNASRSAAIRTGAAS